MKTTLTGTQETAFRKGKEIYDRDGFCNTCHQPDGKGLEASGFPPLKGSPVILDDNPEKLIDIILNGYDPRAEYAVMPAVGKSSNLSADVISAIINHGRTSWGNSAREISPAEVKKIMNVLAKK